MQRKTIVVPHSCPECGVVADIQRGAAAVEARCDRCGVAMRPLGTVPRIAAGVFERRFAVHTWFIGGGLIALAITAALLMLTDSAASLPIVGVIAFVIGAKIALAVGQRRARSRIARWAEATLASKPASQIRHAGGGQVHVVGRAVPVTMISSPSGTPCLAFEQRGAEFDGDFHVRGSGGTFEIDDGSGVRAIVRAQHVLILGGPTKHKESILSPGARVEIVGDARWVAATHEELRGGGMRDAARTLEIIGTPAHPVVIRLIEHDAPAAPAVASRSAQLNAPVSGLEAPAPVGMGVRVDASGAQPAVAIDDAEVAEGYQSVSPQASERARRDR